MQHFLRLSDRIADLAAFYTNCSCFRSRHIAELRETGQDRSMSIRRAISSDIRAWVELRAQLWEDTSLDQHRDEAAMMLARPADECVVFVDGASGTDVRAFAEAALRHDYVNGCETSPVAFLEGIFVRSQDRGSGIGRLLLRSVQSWAQEQGCTELASDAHLENVLSYKFHTALGFEETVRVVYFRKSI